MKNYRTQRPGPRRALPAALRLAMLLALAFGVLVRPVLLLACEQHATAFAHASQPHDHLHPGTDEAGDSGSGGADQAAEHGEHQPLSGAMPGAADVPPAVVVRRIRGTATSPPAATQAMPDSAGLATPFRPPIA